MIQRVSPEIEMIHEAAIDRSTRRGDDDDPCICVTRARARRSRGKGGRLLIDIRAPARFSFRLNARRAKTIGPRKINR